ncbi:glycosyltransferase [Hyphococcus formosus]|uniref:glycosyltransferase family 2 protein n=1 Tax=Hyphococcus formosus TaxID=3143534 RepID=UPI00398AC8BD
MQTPYTPKPYTIVITSCGRFDLLGQTLASLFAHLDRPPAKTILIEDSTDQAVKAVAQQVSHPIDVIVNDQQLGQIASIDKAYALVETPLIFHCEDDWAFHRSGFIAESEVILDAHPNVAMVGLRARDQLNKRIQHMPQRQLDGLAYFLHDPSLHPEYFSYSFNPGLRRLADYHRIGPFAPIGGEADISYAFKKAGFQNANLEEPAVRHIGDERHVHDPQQPRRAKGGLARIRRSIQKRVKRLSRAFEERHR